MKHLLGIVMGVAMASLLSGCPYGNTSKLQKTLGPYQYIGLDPQLSFIVQKARFAPAASKYSEATLTYSINIKQNNKSFPLNRYEIVVICSIQDNNGKQISTTAIRGKVLNGVLSLSDVDQLFGKVNEIPAGEVSQLQLKIKSYTWGPIVVFKPYHDPEGNE